MKILIVTSQITFVPRNYNDLIIEIAPHEDVVGLVELKNNSIQLFLKSLGLCFFIAPNMGFQLLKNIFSFSSIKRKRAYNKLNKSFTRMNTVNCEQMIQLINAQEIDLVVNARTRFIYKKAALIAPKMGCINIHHGLLPKQRGTMCDLWALAEGQQGGFTIHEMTKKIDDGAILTKQIVAPKNKNYLNYLAIATQKELEVLSTMLTEIKKNGIRSEPNNCEKNNIIYRKNPTLTELKRIKANGIII